MSEAFDRNGRETEGRSENAGEQRARGSSTVTTTETAPLPDRGIDTSGTTPVPFLRLARVEARKMIDTRSGFWLLAITGLLLVLTMAITLLVLALNDDVTTSAQALAEIMTIPVSLLVPVFAVLTVTNEWSQRTHMVTFSLEPHRLRVVLAKLVAVSALAIATIALAILLGGVGNLLYGAITGNEVVWNLEASTLGWTVLVQVLFFLMGFGLGMLLLNTPGAIAVFYVVGLILPLMVYPPLTFIFDWFADLLPWIDLNTAFLPFVSDTDFAGQPIAVDGTSYAQAAVATLIYVVAPVVLGTMRVLRAEAK